MSAISSNTGSFNWSNTSAWAGGVVPVNGDSVTIISGSTITFDVNQSGFAAGIAGLTINGSLLGSTSAGTYVLKMNGDIAGSGTFRIDGNGSGSPYPTNCQFNIVFTGNQTFSGGGVDYQFYCAQPSPLGVQLISATSKSISGITKANPAVVTCTSHGYSNGDIVYLANIGGMTDISNMFFKVAGVTTNTFQLQWRDPSLGVDSTNYGTYTSGGLVCPIVGNSTSDTALNVDIDLTSDPVWTSTLGTKMVRVDNVNRYADSEERTISSISSTQITITSGLTAGKVSGSKIWLINRNILVTGSSGRLLQGVRANSMFACEFSGNSGTSGYWSISGATCTIAGACSTAGTFYEMEITITGIISGGVDFSGSDVTMSGIISGCNIAGGFNQNYLNYTGAVYGCTQIASTPADGSIIAGLVFGCGGVIHIQNVASAPITLSGTFLNNAQISRDSRTAIIYSGVFKGNGTVLSGDDWNNTQSQVLSGSFIGNGNLLTGALQATVLVFDGAIVTQNGNLSQGTDFIARGCTFAGNSPCDIAANGVIFPNGIAYNTQFGSSTPFSGYNTFPCPSTIERRVWNYDPVISGVSKLGRIQGWTPGGTITNNESPPSSPPVSLSYTHRFTFEAAYPVYVDVPIMGIAGVLLSISVYLKKSTNSMGETPRIQLIDPAYAFNSSSSKIADTAMTDNTSWQTITVSTTPTTNKQYILRVRGRHTSGTLDWNYVIASTGGGGAFAGMHGGFVGG